MTNISTMPKETLVQLLLYLAENEKFASVSEGLGDGVTVGEVRAVLRELAREVAREVNTEQSAHIADLKKGATLSRKTKEIISYLSPHEEKMLYKAFGLA